MVNDLKGLQTLPEVVDAAPGQIATKVAFTISTDYGVITRTLLVKQWMLMLNIANMDPGQAVVLFLGPTGASVTEIEEALEGQIIDPTDPSSYGTNAQKNRLVWDSLMLVGQPSSDAGAANYNINVNTGWRTIGGGKGIPFTHGNGPILWGWNPNAGNIPSDWTVDGLMVFRGVWLDDS